MRRVDPLVEDPDLDPVARRREAGTPQVRRVDQRRRIDERVVADVRPDLLHAGDPRQPSHRVRRDDDGHPVEHDGVAPADDGAGNGLLDPPLHDALRGGELGEIAAARGRVRKEVPRAREGAEGERARAGDQGGERRLLQGDDDLDGRGTPGRGEREPEPRKSADEKTPSQGENGTRREPGLTPSAFTIEPA